MIKNRIAELQELKENMDANLSNLQIELQEREMEAVAVREEIARNIFENTQEYQELQELLIVEKWLDIMNKEGDEELEEPSGDNPLQAQDQGVTLTK